MNLTTNPICLSLRNNAACCIPLRHLRNLRENNTQEDSIYQRENKQHFICETHINDKERCVLAHTSPIILQSIPCS